MATLGPEHHDLIQELKKDMLDNLKETKSKEFADGGYIGRDNPPLEDLVLKKPEETSLPFLKKQTVHVTVNANDLPKVTSPEDLAEVARKAHAAMAGVQKSFNDLTESLITIQRFRKTVHQTAKQKGWWNQGVGPLTIPNFIANTHAELSEAWEEYRKNNPPDIIYFNGEKPEGFVIEIADVIIRCLDTCEALNLPIEKALLLKAKYNETRPYRHGGKKA